MATEASPDQVLAADRTRVSEIMTRGAVTVRADFGLEQLVELFLGQGISRAPVVDGDGRIIGMVSKTDLVIDQHERGDTGVVQRGGEASGQHVHELGAQVRDVMTPIAITLPETASVGEAARLMLTDNLHAIPIVSDEHQVLGLLSATDIVAWVAGDKGR